MEKMTNPANMLVQELIQQTMMESLQRRNGGLSEGGAGKEVSQEQWLARHKGRGQKRVPGSRVTGQVPPTHPREGVEPEGGSGLERSGVESGERPQGVVYKGRDRVWAWHRGGVARKEGAPRLSHL